MTYKNTILIVDDSEMVAQVLSFTIQKAGFNTVCAADGKQALTYLDGRDVDLMITDLHMPNMDGLELIGQLRSLDLYRYTPAILFFSHNLHEEQKLMTTSGATMLFDKSDIREKIIPTIKKILG